MSALKGIIEAEIAANGPMHLSRYMELCLGHPEHGYYMRQQPFGAAGDFTTAPEISQMFGEIIGLWLVHMWQRSGAPSPFCLLELGPGNGTLMADILRAAKLAPAFLDAAQVCLLENSPRLRAVQRQNLGAVRHITTVDDLPHMPVFAVANEFFDALPVRQFIKNDFGWQERLVGKGLGWVLSDTVQRPDLDTAFPALETGRIIENSAAAIAITAALGVHIESFGGAALIIDYGEFDGSGDTFQAVRRHRKTDVFGTPGQADITCHVRFKNLVPRGLSYAFTTQGNFLRGLGIEARKQALASAGADDGLDETLSRLIGPDEMGNLFKVLALVPQGFVEIAGFEHGA